MQVRDDWAGRFWYSFYERGAVMADFCQRALAYMTGQPLHELRKKKTSELKEPLLAQLKLKPWLLILDGLERVLVAYHRIDAAEIPDEDANNPTDSIVHRNPCDAIRDEDNDLLRALAAATPSKILVSSRLTPRVLLNPSSQPIIGVKRITLPGLRPLDAEQLLRSCGIKGDSANIQNYLTKNCDNHPLVIGILGGLIHNYLPARENFDIWAIDDEGGAKLDLSRLDLIQRRNHILLSALNDLPLPSRQLLSTLTLLSESVDYETLSALNPHIPIEPEVVTKPLAVDKQKYVDEEGNGLDWSQLSDEQKADEQKRYEATLERWQNYDKAMQALITSTEYQEAPKKLAATVTDLEQRGLLQYDRLTQKHDLHPVVRGVSSDGMKSEDKRRHGKRVVDHFSSLSHNPYVQAETLEDLRPGLNVVHTLLKLGLYDEAVDAFTSEFAFAFVFNLEAPAEYLAISRSFFNSDWDKLRNFGDEDDRGYITGGTAEVLQRFNQPESALVVCKQSIRIFLKMQNWSNLHDSLSTASASLYDLNCLAAQERSITIALDLADAVQIEEIIFLARLDRFTQLAKTGQEKSANEMWSLLNPMGRDWSRSYYRPGDAEYAHAYFLHSMGKLPQQDLLGIELLASKGNNRPVLRKLHSLRGTLHLEREEHALAAMSFTDAVRMARESGIQDAESETGLALAKYQISQLDEPQFEAERLSRLQKPAHRLLALLWLALNNSNQAQQHALAAYELASADGEPYVNRYELTKITEPLQQMKVEIPKLPTYDPTKNEAFEWEADVLAAILELNAEREKVKNAKQDPGIEN